MEKKNYVLELGVEEIPAQYIKRMADSMAENAKLCLDEQHLDFDKVYVLYTPRRLTLFVDGLVSAQPDQTVQVKGPATKIAFNEKGEPSAALLGFLKKNGCTVEDVRVLSDGKNEYTSIEHLEKGKQTVDILGACMEKVILSIYNPNPMRWANFKIKFIRPIRWILSLYGEQAVSVKLECAESSNVTYGHRTLANHGAEVKSADAYIETLRGLYVVVDQNERRQTILDQIAAIEKANDLSVEMDADLLEEINNLVEYPTAALGHFEEEYINLPECVIKSPLKTQQRYFPVYRDGKIVNAFVFVRNGDANYLDNVIAGNERVIRPRLADAKFFFAKDRETTLADKADKLKRVVFVNALGSYADKAQRVIAIATKLAAIVGYADVAKIKTVGELMKADLVSNLVREYTDTQGLVGGEFARLEHYEEDVCNAIAEQYLPNFAGDTLPGSNLSAVMAIADKMDSVLGLCAADMKPSGSADPYGLRRQVLGIFLIANDRLFDVDMDGFIDVCAPLYAAYVDASGQSMADFVAFVKSFFLQRLKVFLNEQMKYTKDELDVLSLDDLNIYKSIKKANLIRAIADTDWYKDFLQIYKRIQNLIKSAGVTAITRLDGVQDEAAEEMFRAFADRKESIAEGIRSERYEDAIKLIAECSAYVNKFMSENKALSDDADVKNNRLAFFGEFCGLCSQIIKIY